MTTIKAESHENEWLPNGTYEAVITVSTPCVPKYGGNQSIYLSLQIRKDLHPEFTGMHIQDTLFFTERARYKPAMLAKVVGIEMYEDFELEDLSTAFYLEPVQIVVFNELVDAEKEPRIRRYKPGSALPKGYLFKSVFRDRA